MLWQPHSFNAAQSRVLQVQKGEGDAIIADMDEHLEGDADCDVHPLPFQSDRCGRMSPAGLVDPLYTYSKTG